jgi:hypothetical protein
MLEMLQKHNNPAQREPICFLQERIIFAERETAFSTFQSHGVHEAEHLTPYMSYSYRLPV